MVNNDQGGRDQLARPSARTGGYRSVTAPPAVGTQPRARAVGRAGIGKTTLLDEIVASAEAVGCLNASPVDLRVPLQNRGAGVPVRMSSGPFVDLCPWPGGKPNTDVKSVPYHLSKSNQQREQHKC